MPQLNIPPLQSKTMYYVELVILLAALQYLVFGMLVGRERVRGNIKAPAVTGGEAFERMYRVQMNTLELLIMLLPGLFIAARFWPAEWVAGIGVVYLLGRFIYWRAYIRNPASRSLGFALSIFPVLTLLGLGVVGALRFA